MIEIEVEIGSLLVKGWPASGSHPSQLALLLERSLQVELEARGLPDRLAAGDHARLPARKVLLPLTATADRMAERVAGGVHEALVRLARAQGSSK
jgi:hypothetical protein